MDPAQQRETEHYLFAIHTARREWESPGTQNQPNMSALRHPQRCDRPVENATHKINKRQSIRLGRQYNAERTSASVCLFTTIFFFFVYQIKQIVPIYHNIILISVQKGKYTCIIRSAYINCFNTSLFACICSFFLLLSMEKYEEIALGWEREREGEQEEEGEEA